MPCRSIWPMYAASTSWGQEREQGGWLSPQGSRRSPSQPSTLAAEDHLPPIPATLLTFLSTTDSFSAAVRLLLSSSYLLHLREDSAQAPPSSAF